MKSRESLGKIRVFLMAVSILCLAAAVVILVRNYVADSRGIQDISEPIAAQHRVLFIGSYSPLYFTYEAQALGLDEGLYPYGIEYDVVFMDAKIYKGEEDRLAFRDYLASRLMTDRGYEAVILGDDDALRFALQYQEELFGELPMVFFGINEMSLAEQGARNPHMTGFYETDYLQETLKLAMKLFPEATRYVALHDESAAGAADMEIFYNYAGSYPEHTFTDIDTSLLSQEELVDALESLPEDSILIYMTCYSDRYGNTYSMADRTNTVVSHANVPIFRNYVGGEGKGILGGVSMDFETQCRMAGELVGRVLGGEEIAGIPLNLHVPSRTAFDDQLLKKYGLDPSLLPEDTIYYNREETMLDRYGSVLPAIALIGVALLVLIVSSNIGMWVGRISNDELRRSKDEVEKSREEMKNLADHDDMLGLYNRRAAIDYLTRDLEDSQDYAVLMINIDGFREVNESYGHQLADGILKHLADMLGDAAMERGWFAARYGGDEFLLILPDEKLTAEDETTEEILEIFRAPVPVGDETITLSASIGISNADFETKPMEHIGNAENAMREAKDRGRNCAFLYAEEMKEKAREENRIRGKLLEAFENDGFFMLYQPQINSQTKEVSGYEALVRMKEPGIYPGQFIPIAEKSGWIWRIGRITTRLVIKQLAAWRDAGYELHPVSVNFSSNQLGDTGYLEFVKELLQEYSIPPEFLEIEITEGVFLDHTAQATGLFDAFKEMGIRLLMDDFGTGYSSLGYLTYIPVDVIKLDKSLVDAYLVDGKDSFVRDVITLVHDLDKEMIIEGVEEKWQFERLQEFRADTIQGYYFSKPIPPEEAIVFRVKEESPV